MCGMKSTLVWLLTVPLVIGASILSQPTLSAAQAAAEKGRGSSYVFPAVVVATVLVVLTIAWQHQSVSVQSATLSVGWPALYLYVFGAWALLIAGLAAVLEGKPGLPRGDEPDRPP